MSDGSSTPATCPMAMPPYPVIVHTTANATSHRTRDVGMTEGVLSGRRVTDRKFDTRDASTDNFLHIIILLHKSLDKHGGYYFDVRQIWSFPARMSLNDLPDTSFLQKAKFVLLIEKIKN
jgi:hypothetical protein